jgi:outer membrane biosynthesis protein TonB
MKSAVTHALQIATLAAWVSSGIGAVVGFAVPQPWFVPAREKPSVLAVQRFVDLMDQPEQESPTEQIEEPAENAEPFPVSASPTPPPMPEVQTTTDLPEIPELPAPEIRKTAQQIAPRLQPKTVPTEKPSAKPAAKSSNASGKAPPAVATSLSFGSGAGRQPAPAYPLQARRSNQQGTVVVEFLVGTDGKIAQVWSKVKVKGHAEDVLAAARAL